MQSEQFDKIASLRNEKIKNIKKTLQKIPIISKNSSKVQKRIKNNGQDDQSSPATKNSHSGQDTTPVDMADIKIVSLFEEKYEILEKIGEGANGFVNKCRKIKTGQIFAVKSLMMDQEHILELKRNFISVKQLKHSNIVSYKALYIDMRKKLCYLVMQYVDLPSLQKLKIHDLQKLQEIFYQLLQTLKFMHSKNVCHRDIKSSNILYDVQNKKLKIIDFGTSKKFFRRNTKFDMLTITGSLFYRAPEMFIGGGYDQKVDIWATGIMLYKSICGRTPFESLYLSDTISNIKQGQPTFQDEIWSKVQNNIKNLIRRMLKKDPIQRLSLHDCLKDIWFFSLKFPILSGLTKSYQQIQNVENQEESIQPIKKAIQQPIKYFKQLQTLSHVIKKVDGQDYHLIDSDDETSDVIPKFETHFNQTKKMKKKLCSSLIF